MFILLLFAVLVIFYSPVEALQPQFIFDFQTKESGICNADKSKEECAAETPETKVEAKAEVKTETKTEAKGASETGKEAIKSNKKKPSNEVTVRVKGTEDKPIGKTNNMEKINVLLFWGDGCPHCAQQKPYMESLKKRYPAMEVHSFEVWYNSKNAGLFETISSAYGIKASGVPVTFIGSRAIIGFSETIKGDIEKAIKECAQGKCPNPLELISKSEGDDLAQDKSQFIRKNAEEYIDIPLIGMRDVSKMTLPLMTLVIAGLDSFNPCAFFVLLSLLGLMIHAKSKSRMFIIGGVFVFFSGFIYFLFMTAWLNFFLLMGEVALITTIAGVVSLIIAIINIKDFFVFKKGVSLTISEGARSRLFDRMRRLLRSTSLLSMLLGTVVLAVAANAYELLCTAGFPMVFTRILTLNNLSTVEYYLYLVLYNVIYVIPLFIIVMLFTITLGKRQLTERGGRFLKLLSGLMMFGLGLVLVIEPRLMSSVTISAALLAVALILSIAIDYVYRRLQK